VGGGEGRAVAAGWGGAVSLGGGWGVVVGKVGEGAHRIHWGSSVMSSPGVMMEVEEESLARLVGWGVESMEVSPSASRESSSEAEDEEEGGGLAGKGGRIVNVIVGGEA